MKIVKPFRDLHAEQFEAFSRLRSEVNDTLKPLVEAREFWFFFSRLKEITSFALKLETGRVTDPRRLEDFLGCTIVVPTLTHIEAAEDLVCAHYDLQERRPASDTETPKDPSDFRFDDLRLYVSRRDSGSGRNNDLTGLVFEVQIKTALQYAWGVATHDLTYKTDSVSWPMERIAYQLRAMLEHAEVAIASAEQLSDAPAVSKRNKSTKEMLIVIEQIKRIWTQDRRPSDLKRLATNILALLESSGYEASDLETIVAEERRRIGMLPSNLSPYAVVLQSIARTHETELKRALSRGRIKILVHGDMDLPEWLTAEHRGVIRI